MAGTEIIKMFSEYWKANRALKDEHVRVSIYRVKKYLELRYGANIPDKEQILSDYLETCRRPDEVLVGMEDFYILRAAKSISNRPGVIFDIYEKLKNSTNFWKFNPDGGPYKYASGLERNIEGLAYFIFHKKFFGEIGKEDLLNLDIKQRNEFIEKIRTEFRSIYKERLIGLTENYARGIVFSIQLLEKLGAMDSLINSNNATRRDMGLGEVLKFSFDETGNNGEYNVKVLEDEEFLKKQSLEKLALLHAFYSSKTKKIVDSFGLGLFIGYKQNDFTFKDFNIDRALNHGRQYITLSKILENCWKRVDNNLLAYTHEESIPNASQIIINMKKVYEEFFKPFETVYSYYSEEADSLEEDYGTFTSTLTITDYSQKDCSMETLLLLASEEFHTVNWGYVPEVNKKNGKNSIQNDLPEILFAFDIPGFNSMVELHIPRSTVDEFYSNVDESYDVPDYVGNEDIKISDNKNIGTPLLMLLSPQHRKKFISFVKGMKPDAPYYKYAKHLECIQYENNLYRIQKWKNPNGRRSGRTFTNLKTGNGYSVGPEKI